MSCKKIVGFFTKKFTKNCTSSNTFGTFQSARGDICKPIIYGMALKALKS
jgi:hypothetical protein